MRTRAAALRPAPPYHHSHRTHARPAPRAYPADMLRLRSRTIARALAPIAAALAATPAFAQSRTYELDSDAGGWVQTEAPEPGSDAAVIAEARAYLAADKPDAAKSILNRWIKANERTRNPYMPEALLLRGDAKVADRDEYKALYDYERLILDHPESPAFVTAIERELDIAIRYVNGLRRKTFGLRIESAEGIGEELLIRVQERLPGSRLAERAGIELADHYFRKREMALASDAYELFLVNFPESRFRKRAMQRRVYANIARFKGPEYDASGLREAKLLVQDFAEEFPVDAERTGLNEALLARLDESAAAQMLDTATWYLRTSDPVSARYTLRRLVRDYPRTVAATAALQIMDDRGWAPARSAPVPQPLGPEAPAAISDGAQDRDNNDEEPAR